MILLTSVLAAPSTLHSPSVRPQDGNYFGLNGTAHAYIAPFDGAAAETREGFRLIMPMSKQFTFDLLGGRRTLSFSRGRPDQFPELSARVTMAIVARERFRFGITAGVGTELSAGISLWASNQSGRIEFDLHAGYTEHIDWSPGREWEPPRGGIAYSYTDIYRTMPEFGVRWYLDDQFVHSLRMGFWSANPILTYRFSPGDSFTFSVTAGTLLFINTAAVDLGWRF